MTRRNTRTFEEVKKGELVGFFGFALSLLFVLLLAWVAGCGGSEGFGIPGKNKPVVDILCDEAACTILVYNADNITVWRDGEFYWFDDIISPDRRYTNRDAAPEVSITVEACNENGCTERTLVVLELAQNDDDPIGCDPSLPCPIEVTA